MPSRHCLYILGQPGAGKSAILAATLKGVMASQVPKPVNHIVYQNRGIQLGARREGFSGTDALALNAQPTVVSWLTSITFPYKAVVAEGDRLANEKFFSSLLQQESPYAWSVMVIHLDVPDEVAAERCAARGSNQDPTWVAGRRTKVKRLAANWAGLTLDGTKSIEELVVQLREQPVIQMLRGGK